MLDGLLSRGFLAPKYTQSFRREIETII